MRERPDVLESKTYKIRPPVIDCAIYITISDEIAEDGSRRPREVFINSKNVQSFQWVSLVTRLLSAQLRQDGPFPSFVIEEMLNTFDTDGGYIIPGAKGRRANSIVAHIGMVFEDHCKALGLVK